MWFGSVPAGTICAVTDSVSEQQRSVHSISNRHAPTFASQAHESAYVYMPSVTDLHLNIKLATI